MRFSQKLLFPILASIITGLLIAVLANAWTNPSQAPSGGGGALYYSGGNVGIGTSTPQVSLDIVASNNNPFSANTMVRITNTGTGGGILNLVGGGVGARNFSLMSSGSGNVIGAGKFEIGNFAGTSYLVIDGSNGYIGIGTAEPGAKIDVAGNIRFQSAAMSSTEDILLKSLAAIYAQTLPGGQPAYHYWNDAVGQSCTTKCSNMGHTCIGMFAIHQGYVSMPGCSYNGTAGLACLCNP